MDDSETPWKLFFFANGKLAINSDAVAKLKKAVDSSAFGVPTTFLCVIGDTGSGKSFYTNLFINYLNQEGTSNSLMKFSKSNSNNSSRSTYLPGFAFGRSSSHKLFQVEIDEPTGIYVWPKPFQQRNYHGEFLLWILHLHFGQENHNEQNILTYFIHLLCSRVITIMMDDDKKPTFTSSFDFLENKTKDCKIQFEKSIMHICRTNLKPFQTITIAPEKATNTDISSIPSAIRDIDRSPHLNKYNFISVAFISNFSTPFHDTRGRLGLNQEACCQLDQVVKLMGEPNHTWPNVFNGKPLATTQVSAYFRECIRLAEIWSSSEVITRPVKEPTTVTSVAEPLRPRSQVKNISRQYQIVNKSEEKQIIKGHNIEIKGGKHAADNGVFQRGLSMFRKSRKVPAKNEAKSNFQAVLNNAIQEVEINMSTNYADKLLAGLNEMPERFVDKIFKDSVNDSIGVFKKSNNLTTVEVERLYDSQQNSCAHIYADYVSNHKLVKQYDAVVKLQMNEYLYSFPSLKINQLLSSIKQRLFGSTEKPLSGYVTNALERLRKDYFKKLERVGFYEDLALKQAIRIILAEYKFKMNEIITIRQCSPKQLSEAHIYLCSKFATVLKSCETVNCLFKENHMEFSEQLKFHLTVEFKEFRERNRMTLQNLHKEITNLFTSLKKLYCDAMEEAVRKRIVGQMLIITHNNLLKKLNTQLESDLSRILGAKNNSQTYWKTLESHIVTEYWVNFQKSEGVNKLRATHKNVEVRRNQTLAPIIFHLSLSQIGVAIYQTNRIQRFANNSLLVGITAEGKWIYGNQANISDRKSSSNFQNIWNVGDHLAGKKPSSKEIKKVVVGEAEIIVTTELLLSFLFQKLREEVEKSLGGNISQCITIIPFWFTSYQRQQINQAGKIAGFEDIEILNENSAIALYAAQRILEEKQSHDIFVISENSDRVDATVYNIDSKANVVRMIGHFGNYELSRTSGTTEQTVKMACKKAIKQCRNSLVGSGKIRKNTRMIFTCYETEGWASVLTSARETIAHGVNGDVSGWESDLATLGAAIYSQNHATIPQEWVSSPILYAANESEYELFPKKQDCYLPQKGKLLPIPIFMPSNIAEARYYQKAFRGKRKTVIGLLSMSKAQNRCKLEVIVNHHGIMSFSNLILDNPSDSFTWNATNLNEAQVSQKGEILKKILAASNNNENKRVTGSENFKQVDLIKKFKEIQARIINGEGQFRTDVGRQMAMTQVKNDLEILSSPVSTAKFQAQLANYATIKAKYFY